MYIPLMDIHHPEYSLTLHLLGRRVEILKLHTRIAECLNLGACLNLGIQGSVALTINSPNNESIASSRHKTLHIYCT